MKYNSIPPQVINLNDMVIIVLYIYGYALSVFLQEL